MLALKYNGWRREGEKKRFLKKGEQIVAQGVLVHFHGSGISGATTVSPITTFKGTVNGG